MGLGTLESKKKANGNWLVSKKYRENSLISVSAAPRR
jgi:hypothetical protein